MELEQSTLATKHKSLKQAIMSELDKTIKKLTVDKKMDDKRYDDLNRTVK